MAHNYLYRRAELTGDNISEADLTWDRSSGRPEVALGFDSEGAALFEKLTGRNVGRKMAIIFDGKINSAPVIESAIKGGHARITMGGADPNQLQAEANDLVNVLRSGALAAPISLRDKWTVAPRLARNKTQSMM